MAGFNLTFIISSQQGHAQKAPFCAKEFKCVPYIVIYQIKHLKLKSLTHLELSLCGER